MMEMLGSDLRLGWSPAGIDDLKIFFARSDFFARKTILKSDSYIIGTYVTYRIHLWLYFVGDNANEHQKESTF